MAAHVGDGTETMSEIQPHKWAGDAAALREVAHALRLRAQRAREAKGFKAWFKPRNLWYLLGCAIADHFIGWTPETADCLADLLENESASMRSDPDGTFYNSNRARLLTDLCREYVEGGVVPDYANHMPGHEGGKNQVTYEPPFERPLTMLDEMITPATPAQS